MDQPAEIEHERAPAPTESELFRYLRVLYGGKWVIAACLAVGGALFAVWASRQLTIYSATATIVVDATPPQVMGGEVKDVVQVGPGQYWQMQDYIQTQRRVLTSDSLGRRVVEKLKLLGDSGFWGPIGPADLDSAGRAFIDGVTAEPVPDTDIIQVSYRHLSPDQAKRAVDGLVDVYIENNGARRDSSTASASTWLATEADELRRRLSQSELALYEFKRQNDLLSVSLEERVNNVGRQVDRLSDALTEARLRRVARAAEQDELVKMNAADPESISPVVGSPALDALKGQLVDEQRRLSELKARYEDPHPLVKQESAKVQNAAGALSHEIARLIRGAEARTNEAVDQEKKIATQLEASKQEGLRITRLEIDYNKLKRETDSLSKQYSMVENRTKETELTSKIKVNNLHVLDYARPAGVVSPHLVRSGVTWLVVALLIGVMLAFLLDALDRSIKSQEDVESKLKLPFLGIFPRISGGPHGDLYAAENPQSVAAECCRVIRTNLLFSGLKTPLKHLLVTSSLAREGKTLTSISLATVMAQAGSRVLLIDADLRSPRLKTALGIERDIGLTDVLLGHATLEQAIQPTGIPNLSVLLSGGVPPNPAEVIEGAGFRALLEECGVLFERVVLDSPPVLPVIDPAILARYCGGVVLVVRAGRTGQAQARRARQTLADLGARLLGVVLNDCDLARRGYGYGYGYGRYGYGQRRTEAVPQKRAVN